MSGRNPSHQILGLALVVLLLAGCVGLQAVPTATPVPPTALPTPTPVSPTVTPTQTPAPPTATLVPPPTATPMPEPLTAATIIAAGGDMAWDYVAIGDPVANGFVEFYAEHIEADLGVEVKVHNWCSSSQSSGVLLYLLRNEKEMRSDIREAEVVTFDVNAYDFGTAENAYRHGRCGGPDNQDCLREVVASLNADTDAIIAEILSLRNPSDTIIRTMTWPVPYIDEYRSEGTLEDLYPYWVAFNQYILQAASEHNIPVARVELAFNGPDGDEDPEGKGYLSPDRVHPGQAGFSVIADLHRELGYEPLAP